MQYRHYKGGLYDHVCVATLESDLSEMIVYRAPDGSIWTRPKHVFFQMIEVNGAMVQRFTPIVDQAADWAADRAADPAVDPAADSVADPVNPVH